MMSTLKGLLAKCDTSCYRYRNNVDYGEGVPKKWSSFMDELLARKENSSKRRR